MTAPSQKSLGRYLASATSAAAPSGTDAPEVEARAADRVIVFSDAVIAIAITLLALALPLPATTDATTNGQLLHGLHENFDQYGVFVLSFAVIGSNWSTHRGVFRYVNRMNSRVNSLNMSWLLLMILTPFAARLLAINGGFGVRFTIYTLIQVIATACLIQMSRQISRNGLLRSDAPASARHPDNVANFTLIAVFLVSIPVAFVTPWAFATWVAVPVLTRVLHRRAVNGRHSGSDASY
ncbi:MAG: TMEM175 family protein [Streptosporangiaceae bacterium]